MRAAEVTGESGSHLVVDSAETRGKGSSVAVVKLEAGQEEARVELVEREGDMGVWAVVGIAGVLSAD